MAQLSRKAPGMSAKRKLKPRIRTYDILCNAVEAGVSYGYMRAHKHTDKPSEEHVKDELIKALIGELCERFEVSDDA